MRTRGTILIVDDQDYVRESLATILRRRGFDVRSAIGPKQALEPTALQGVDAVITDLRMPEQDGLSLLRALSENGTGIPVIVLTGHGTVLSAVECMRAGAHDYLLKPANPDALVLILERALSQKDMRRELDYLRSGADRESCRGGPLGVSAAWKQAVEMVEAAAPTDTSVLLVGESGTGKEELAQFLHRRSSRANGPLVRVNCAAIPLELFESEFFGYRRGAFTGAVSDREGRFRVAHRGTLFMDEIGSMPEAAQVKILRVLQDGAFERLGDSHPTTVDVRIVAATNLDLDAEVEAGRFRRDLFYRINVLTVSIAPLRERWEDIPVLAGTFLAEFAARLARPVQSIHADTMASLKSYSWPGNVRELRNVIERAVLLEKTRELLPSSLPFNVRQNRTTPGDLNLHAARVVQERRTLEEALRRANGVRGEAARLLGIDQRNLNYFLKKHGLAKSRQA